MRRALILAVLTALPLPAAAQSQREIDAVAAAHKAGDALPAGTRFRRVEGQALAGLLAGRRWTFREGALRADFDVFRDGRLRVRFRDPALSGRSDTPRTGRWWMEGREICLTLAAGTPDASSCAVGYVSGNTVLIAATRGGPEGKARKLLAILSHPRRLN